MTTDITELAQREKFEAWWEREYKHLESSKYTDAVPHIKYGFWMAYQAGGAELVEALEKAQQHIARQEQILLNQDESLSIRRGELEAAQQERESWRTSFDNERFRADKLKAHIDDIEPVRAAAEKLVRCKGRYHSEQNYRALAALFGVTTPDLPPLDSESRTVTIEPFRAFVTDADLAALHRFAECCDDPESGGHDLEKEQVRRLESIGALQRSGRISYITGFGDFLISITAGIKWGGE
ncbi:hypothetical protein [Klebsiella aerogenes]|uniref:hypothetical protein n=1 Tax=Klebsiella aerogenes TaxID=548 RepID=UPI00339CD095|nr:hypothetical protein [Klebsiella aerogenes]